MTRLLLTLSLLVFPFAAPALAQDEASDPAPAAEGEAPEGETPDPADAASDAEEIPAPVSDPGPRPAKDTLELKNGESLQGETVQLKGGKLKFKSETVGEQTIPLETVKELHTAKELPVILGGTPLTGYVDIDGDGVKVRPTAGEGAEGQVAELTDINPAPPKVELDYWTFHGTLGGTMTFGNTRTKSLGALAILRREDDLTRSSLSYVGTYGQDRDGENAKAHRGDGQFDIKITDRFYASPFVGHVLYDKFQNIRWRYRVGSGAGYNILIEDDLKWNVEAGFAYGFQELRLPGPGADKRTYSTSARLATTVHYALNSMVTFDLAWETYVGTKDIEDTVHHAVGAVSVKLMKGLALSLAAIYDRVERPQRNVAGKLPKRNDLKLIFGLSVTL